MCSRYGKAETDSADDPSTSLSFEEASIQIDKLYKQLIENGWTMGDIENSDYFYLLHLFTETESNDNTQMSAESFFESIGQVTT